MAGACYRLSQAASPDSAADAQARGGKSVIRTAGGRMRKANGRSSSPPSLALHEVLTVHEAAMQPICLGYVTLLYSRCAVNLQAHQRTCM